MTSDDARSSSEREPTSDTDPQAPDGDAPDGDAPDGDAPDGDGRASREARRQIRGSSLLLAGRMLAVRAVVHGALTKLREEGRD